MNEAGASWYVSARLRRMRSLLWASVVELKLRDFESALKAGQTVEVHVDRKMCFSCEKVLPLVGLELGHPTVKFVDPNGRVRTMRNGNWEPER